MRSEACRASPSTSAAALEPDCCNPTATTTAASPTVADLFIRRAFVESFPFNDPRSSHRHRDWAARSRAPRAEPALLVRGASPLCLPCAPPAPSSLRRPSRTVPSTPGTSMLPSGVARRGSPWPLRPYAWPWSTATDRASTVGPTTLPVASTYARGLVAPIATNDRAPRTQTARPGEDARRRLAGWPRIKSPIPTSRGSPGILHRCWTAPARAPRAWRRCSTTPSAAPTRSPPSTPARSPSSTAPGSPTPCASSPACRS